MPTGKQNDFPLEVLVDGEYKSVTLEEFGQMRRELDMKIVEQNMKKDESAYAQIAEQNERYDAVLGIDSQNPVGNTKSQTVSTDSNDFENTTVAYVEDRFTTKARTSDSRNELLTFPSDLATDGRNRYWTKLTVYEVQYNANDDTEGANSKLKVYRKGKAAENAKFVDGEKMAQRKYAYDTTQKDTFLSDYTNNYVMTNLTMALPMPNNDPQWEFMLQWGDQANWGWTGAISDIVGQLLKGEYGKAFEEGREALDRLIRDLQQKLPIAGQLVKGGRKEFINDRAEYLFNGFSDTRRPNFNWTLYPKNQKESETLLDIIETLKSLCLPAIKQTASGKGNKNTLMFPALFEICFMTGDQENTSMPRFGPLAIQNFKVIAIQDKWQAHRDGSPIGYQIDMSGVELVHPLRDNLEDDGTHMYIR